MYRHYTDIIHTFYRHYTDIRQRLEDIKTDIKTYIKTDIKRYRYKDRHKDTGTQRHRRDTKTQEGEITHRYFRRIKGELTDLKDFIRGDH